MPLLSYAQNLEDVMLWRALGHVNDGFYIDVGAADPVALSVTKLFYDQGWRGLNVEPNPAYFAALREARPRDINVPLAAGRETCRRVFHNFDGTGLSTFDDAIAAQHESSGRAVDDQPVDVVPLAEICRQYRPDGPIHFLKIDVEGSEEEVLAGADFAVFRPWIVLVEATLPLVQDLAYDSWEPLLTGQGYGFVWFDGLNRFYVSDERADDLRQHFGVQPNIFDNFVPASALLQRAEHAEQTLHRVEAQANHDVRQTADALRQSADALQQMASSLVQQSNISVEAQQRCGFLEGQLAEARAQHAAQAMLAATALAQQTNLTGESQRRTADLEATLADLRQQAARTEETLTEVQAELDIRTAQANATLAEQASRLAAAQARCATLTADLAQTEGARSAVSQRLDETHAHLVTIDQLLRQSTADLAQTVARADLAELYVHRLRTSTSWRLTAPLRMVRRLFGGLASDQWPVTQPPPAPSRTKALARRIFHRCAATLLRIPGGRRASRVLYAIFPAPLDWLALRYRAYENQPLEPGSIVPVALRLSMPEPVQRAQFDLSEEEEYLYRQLVTSGRVHHPDMAGT